jgi:predicted alpha/beta-hydrolase family hydrolase
VADPDIDLLLGPGASGGVEALEPHVAGLAARGIVARTVPLPTSRAERAVGLYRSALDSTPGRPFVGGHSFGGRVASLLAAEEAVRGVVLLSYPLHAPGRVEAWDERTAHWPRIGCPVLLLSGEADPFARIGLLRDAVKRLANAELVTYPGVGHGLLAVLDDALDRIAEFVRRVR